MNGLNRNIKSLTRLLGNDFSFLRTVYFNFHYFSFPVAIKFPIFIYKSVRFKRIKGQIIIDSQPIKTGMIHIGKKIYGFHRKYDLTIWEQHGGTVILEVGVIIGKGTFISVGKNAELRIEHNSHFGGNDKIICWKSVTIKSNTLVAWDVQIIDTDFRATINTITKAKNCIKKAIIIGKNNWLCFGSTILKGSMTPNHCIVGAKSIINKDFSNEGENIVIGTESNVKVLAKYISFDFLAETED